MIDIRVRLPHGDRINCYWRGGRHRFGNLRLADGGDSSIVVDRWIRLVPETGALADVENEGSFLMFAARRGPKTL